MDTHGGGLLRLPTSYVLEEKKEIMFIPINQIFLYMKQGLPGSSLNGLVNVMNKERMKKERKKINRKEGHTANRNRILKVYRGWVGTVYSV